MSELMTQARSWALTPLDGGPVTLPLVGLTRLASLVSAGTDVSVAVRVGRPEDAVLHGEWDRTGMQIDLDGGAIHFCLSTVHDANSDLFHRLGVALENAGPPAGTTFELACHSQQVSWASQRYLGTIEGKAVSLTSSYPALKSELLAGALELFRQGEEERCLSLASEDVASRVFQASEESLEFGNDQFVLRGAQIEAKESIADDPVWLTRLAGYAMLRTPQFAEAWNLHEALLLQETELANAASSLRAVTAQYQAARRQYGPQRQLVYLGKSEFSTAELGELAHIHAQDEADLDALFLELGFRPVGGLTSSDWYGSVAKAYSGPGGEVFGLVRADLQGRCNLDFRSSLADGGEVVTSTRADEAEDEPALPKASWLRYATYPKDSLKDLLAYHRQALSQAGPTRAVEGLSAIAEALDRVQSRLRAS